MKGLWRVPITAIQPSLGVVVVDGIVAFILTVVTGVSIAITSRHWPQARLLQVGMILLSSWFLLHLIDQVIRYRQVPLVCSYIISGAFFTIFRGLSDVFVLWGTFFISIRYRHVRPNSYYYFATALGAVLVFFALYHLCLLAALSVVWLDFVDVLVIEEIALTRSAMEITFTTLQFCATAILSIKALNEEESGSEYPQEIKFMKLASIFLLIRSFSEVVIVGQLNRWPDDLQTIFQARDIMYGLFSTLFVLCITPALPRDEGEDTLAKAADDRDRAERVAKNGAVQDVNRWFLAEVERATEGGIKTAPPISVLLDGLSSSVGLKEPSNDEYGVWNTKRKEIERLRAFYAEWEPICKYRGETPAP